jgi:hypothetical protein
MLAFTAIVSPRIRRRKRYTLLSLTLLLSLELLVIDRNSSVYIHVERLRISVGLNKFVLNVVL